VYYKCYCSILRKTIRGAKKLYNQLIAKSENKNKMTWKIVKNLRGKIQNSQHVFSTFSVDGVEQSPEQAVEGFNNYFLNITENLNIHIPQDDNPISYYPSKFPTLQIVPITEAEIRSIISSLKSNNSFGYDEISTKILKLCRNQISRPLNYICDRYIIIGVFPDRLKCATVMSLHKKGDI
jgi:hypothetical protein